MKTYVSPEIIKEELEHCLDRLSVYNLEATVKQIRSNSRQAELNGMRALIAEMLHRKKYTSGKIGAILNRDHASILHMFKYEDYKSGRLNNYKDINKALKESHDKNTIEEQIARHEKAINKLKDRL